MGWGVARTIEIGGGAILALEEAARPPTLILPRKSLRPERAAGAARVGEERSGKPQLRGSAGGGSACEFGS